MTRPKLNPQEKGKYNRDTFFLVKRWQICLALASLYHKSDFTDEQLLIIKETIERDRFLTE